MVLSLFAQVILWTGKCVVMPSCPCLRYVKCHVQRIVCSVPGHPGHSAHTPALEKTQRASRRDHAPYWPTTQEMVGVTLGHSSICLLSYSLFNLYLTASTSHQNSFSDLWQRFYKSFELYQSENTVRLKDILFLGWDLLNMKGHSV